MSTRCASIFSILSHTAGTPNWSGQPVGIAIFQHRFFLARRKNTLSMIQKRRYRRLFGLCWAARAGAVAFVSPTFLGLGPSSRSTWRNVSPIAWPPKSIRVSWGFVSGLFLGVRVFLGTTTGRRCFGFENRRAPAPCPSCWVPPSTMVGPRRARDQEMRKLCLSDADAVIADVAGRMSALFPLPGANR